MSHSTEGWHGTTILTVRKGNRVVVAGDGQVSVGHTIMKSNSRKVRPLSGGAVLAGFAGVVMMLRPTLDQNQLFAGLIGLLSGLGAARGLQ